MGKLLTFFICIILFSCGNDDDNNTFSITIDNIGINSVEISWGIPSQSNNLTIFYRILVNGNEVASDLTVRNYLITGLADDTTYTVTVHSLDSNGNGTFAEASFTTERALYYNAVLTLTTQEEVDTFNYTGVHTLELVGSDITDLSNLEQLTTIIHRLLISNTSIQNLDGLANTQSLGDGNKTLRIENNPLLEDISGLSQYVDKVVYFYLINNPNLSSLTNIHLKPFSNTITIDNIAATDFSNFSNILTVSHSLTIRNTPINTVGGFTNLSSVGSYLRLNNVSVNLASSFTSLNEIGYGGLRLENLNIQDLSIFSNIQNCGRLYLENMPQLNSLSGAEINGIFRILSITGDTQISDFSPLFLNNDTLLGLTLNNTPFSDLSMLSGLTRIGTLSISNTNLITDYTGLDNVGHISNIAVNDCPSFTSFDGAPLDSTWGDLSISINNNPNLSDFCALRQLIDNNDINYVLDPGVFEYYVSGNAYNPTMEEIVTPEGCSQ